MAAIQRILADVVDDDRLATLPDLVTDCGGHLELVAAARKNGSRRLLPLLVHPATLAAQANTQSRRGH